jgi:hypothetical protein
MEDNNLVFGVLRYWYFHVHCNSWGRDGWSLKLTTNLILLPGLEIHKMLFCQMLHDYVTYSNESETLISVSSLSHMY